MDKAGHASPSAMLRYESIVPISFIVLVSQAMHVPSLIGKLHNFGSKERAGLKLIIFKKAPSFSHH